MDGSPYRWLFDGHLAGGGVLISSLVHRIDLMRFLLGGVRRISGLCRTTRPEFTDGAEDYVWATLEFECGAVGEVFGTYSGFRVPWGESFMLFGDDGSLHAVPPLGELLGPAWIAMKEQAVSATLSWMTQYQGFVPVVPAGNQLSHFEESIRTHIEPFRSGRANLGIMSTVLGIYQSFRQGVPVDVSAMLR